MELYIWQDLTEPCTPKKKRTFNKKKIDCHRNFTTRSRCHSDGLEDLKIFFKRIRKDPEDPEFKTRSANFRSQFYPISKKVDLKSGWLNFDLNSWLKEPICWSWAYLSAPKRVLLNWLGVQFFSIWGFPLEMIPCPPVSELRFLFKLNSNSVFHRPVSWVFQRTRIRDREIM